jgi:hypothetical protein
VSKVRKVGYVVEGATDFIVLDEIVARLLGNDDYIPTVIQPLLSGIGGDQGPLGGGWRGVLRWCEELGRDGDFGSSLVVKNFDVIIIHIDAEVAMESDYRHWNSSCPPASERGDKLRAHMLNLLRSVQPSSVVFCVPAQSLEAWVFASLYSEDVPKYADFECRKDPEALLIYKPHGLVSGNPPKKITAQYRKHARSIRDGWLFTVTHCGEAIRFENEFNLACS